MKHNFETSLGLVLRHEGGYADHPADPGGKTMNGITERVYHNWLRSSGRPVRPVRDITETEVAAIYRDQYWNAISADRLPSGIDYALFDFAVNSGPARAVKSAQRILGSEPDGIVGVNTLAAARKADASATISALSAARRKFVRSLRTYGTFGRGWDRRIDEVEAKALVMARGQTPIASVKNVPGRADPGKMSILSRIIEAIALIFNRRSA